jgi:predicted transcriptional regulator
MQNNKAHYAEILACPEYMQGRSESFNPWFIRDAEADAERADTIGEMMKLVRTMAKRVLTPRQKVIFRLCYQEHRTQVEIALLLGISQATVNHHLIGKMTRGKVQGGAMQKIRKGIRKAMKSGEKNVRRQQLLAALNDLLGTPVTRRSMASSLRGLRR